MGTWHQDRDQPPNLSDGNQLLIWNLQRRELILEPATVSAVGGGAGGILHPFPRAHGLCPCTKPRDQLSSHAASLCPAPLCPACPCLASPQQEHGPPRGALGLDLAPTPALLSPCRVPAPWEGLWGCTCLQGSCSAESSLSLHLCLQQLPVVRSAFPSVLAAAGAAPPALPFLARLGTGPCQPWAPGCVAELAARGRGAGGPHRGGCRDGSCQGTGRSCGPAGLCGHKWRM